MEKQFNVCFGCNETGDVKTCQKTDCFAYPFRKSSIVMDNEYNSQASLIKMREEMKLGIRTSARI